MPAKKKSAAKRAPKKAPAAKPAAGDEGLFDRVATILEQARANVVRAVNSHMVLAYPTCLAPYPCASCEAMNSVNWTYCQ